MFFSFISIPVTVPLQKQKPKRIKSKRKVKTGLSTLQVWLISCRRAENVPTGFATAVVSVGFIHGPSARSPVKGHGSTSRAARLQSADAHAHLVVQVEQVWGQVCLVLPIHQVAVTSQMQICSGLLCVFAATWIRQPLGTTPELRSSSRLRLSVPSPAPRSTHTPSATRLSPPHNPKTTSARRQVSLLLFHPLVIIRKSSDLLFRSWAAVGRVWVWFS